MQSEQNKEKEGMTIANKEGLKLLKMKMVDFGRCDFVKYLSELLEVSKTTASYKLRGLRPFKQGEIMILTIKLGLSDDEIREIFLNHIDSEGVTENVVDCEGGGGKTQ